MFAILCVPGSLHLTQCLRRSSHCPMWQEFLFFFFFFESCVVLLCYFLLVRLFDGHSLIVFLGCWVGQCCSKHRAQMPLTLFCSALGIAGSYGALCLIVGESLYHFLKCLYKIAASSFVQGSFLFRPWLALAICHHLGSR